MSFSEFFLLFFNWKLTQLILSHETNLSSTEFIVRIYYGSQRVTANKKIIVMSWISLLCRMIKNWLFKINFEFLANLGGSFALCLGMSMLSLLEIIYFLTVRMVKHIKRIFQVGPVIPKFAPIIVKPKY